MGCKTSRGDFFYLPRVLFPSLLSEPQADPLLSIFFCLFSCRMERVYKEVSSSQAGRWRGTPREMPTGRSLVAGMSAEKEVVQLGSYRNQFGDCRRPDYFNCRGGRSRHLLHPRVVRYRALLPRPIVNETVSTLYPGTSCTCTPRMFFGF